MSLQDFVVAKPRPLPVLILADTSGSMSGEKIQALNAALREMTSTLKQIEDTRGQIEIGVITFGQEANTYQPLMPIGDMTLCDFTAAGRTPMGAAFDIVRQIVENREVIPSRAFTPTIILISDGLPTDLPHDLQYHLQQGNMDETDVLTWPALQALHSSERGSKCVRLAMGIGDDAHLGILKAFVNNPEIPVIHAHDAGGIQRFFRWVTMSVSSRSISRDPNNFIIPGIDLFADDEIVN